MRQYTEYNRLPTAERAQYVWENGTYLLCRCEGRYVITLHALGNHYVEILLDGRRHQVEKVLPFRNTDRLKPFLEKISLPDSAEQ